MATKDMKKAGEVEDLLEYRRGRSEGGMEMGRGSFSPQAS
jgi:hypothetical protein